MRLFEISTGKTGESFIRCYAWQLDEYRARAAFAAAHPREKIAEIKQLLSDWDRAFITELSDCCFAERAERDAT